MSELSVEFNNRVTRMTDRIVELEKQIKTALTILEAGCWSLGPNHICQCAPKAIAALACPECKGTKVVVTDTNNDGAAGSYPVAAVPCPSCGGEKQVCQLCGKSMEFHDADETSCQEWIPTPCPSCGGEQG